MLIVKHIAVVSHSANQLELFSLCSLVFLSVQQLISTCLFLLMSNDAGERNLERGWAF